MGTQVPRIQVTLKPETFAIVSRLAELQKGSRSRIIAELVDEVAPHLEKLLAVLELASAATVDRREKVDQEANTLLDLMLPHAHDAHQALDRLASVLTVEDDAGPPSSNTGVTRGLSHSNHSKRADSQ